MKPLRLPHVELHMRNGRRDFVRLPLLDAKVDETSKKSISINFYGNYNYPFVFLEFMINHARSNKADIIYCDFATRTNKDFFIDAGLERGRITNGCMMISKEVANTVPYTHRTYAGDWFFVEECLKRGKTFSKLSNLLFFAY